LSEKYQVRTVLVIEDEANIRNFASRVLELEGYRVLQAENGDEGLRLVRESQIDLILLDLKLPSNDGWLMLQQLKNDPELSSIPVVVFTASAEVSRRDRALSMGLEDYLMKPVSAATLKTAVGRAPCLKRRRWHAIKKVSVLVVDDDKRT